MKHAQKRSAPRRVRVYEEEETVRERPRKKNSRLLNILTVVFAAVFLISGGILVWELLINPYFTDRNNNDIQSVYSEAGGTESEAPEEPDAREETYARRVAAVKKLQEVNPDISGWLKIDGTQINFPVLTPPADDPEYYLYRNYKKEDTKYGSIFTDKTAVEERDNTVLHGHSMQDGRMFWELIGYGDAETIKKTPLIRYDTAAKAGDWKIISVFKTNTVIAHGEPFIYTQSDFATDEERMQFYYEVMQRSMVDMGVDLNEDDELVMLSTCSYEYDGFRTVVVARRVRPEESTAVDITKIKKNENALFPDVWYSSGAAPDYWPERFEDAVSGGLVDWYSGRLYS